ncbi:MAG: hypothetical protein ABMB14_20395 [Myxococcota bacterium]
MPVVSMLAAAAALAQTRPDQEYRSEELRGKRELTVTGGFESEYYEFDNLDFRKLDESSDQAILDSDDRGAFAFTGANLAIAYQVDPQIRFVFEGSHRGLWGDDQIGSTNQYGGFLYIPSLYVDLATAPDNGVNFRVGRQYFTIGGLGGAKDYALADVLDMVRVDVPLPGAIGHVSLIPINVFSVSGDISEVNFQAYIGEQFPETIGFRGETLTRRFGAVVLLDELPGPVDAAAYAFDSLVGARGTGSDLSYDGQLGNFIDKDYVVNFGVRASATFADLVVPFAHFDGSSGIDRKELVVEDVDTNGFAYGGGVRIDGSTMLANGHPGVFGELSYFDAFGPAYAENGQQYSHGYVGMKGQQVGGILLSRFMGWHPSAYLGRNGVDDRPHDIERKSATRVIHAGAGFELPVGLRASAGWWMLTDSGITYLNFSDLDNITPPYGYSRSEYAAERRLGQGLANELDVEVGWEFGEHVNIYGGGATVLPGPYYRVEIDRVAGTALGSEDAVSAWTAYGGAQVEF